MQKSANASTDGPSRYAYTHRHTHTHTHTRQQLYRRPKPVRCSFYSSLLSSRQLSDTKFYELSIRAQKSANNYQQLFCQPQLVSFHTVDYGPVIKRQLALTYLFLRPCVVKKWARYPQGLGGTKPSQSTVWKSQTPSPECGKSYTMVHHAPYSILHTPYSMHHAPCTKHRAPCITHHTPCAMHHAPSTKH